MVGHADGGLVCWATATLHPRSVSRIAVLGSPHPRALRQAVLTNADERRAFLAPFLHNQLPRLGEKRLTRGSSAWLDEYFRERAGAAWLQTPDFADALPRNRDAMLIPGVAHCSLEYRRWAFRSQFRGDGRRFMDLMNKRLHIPVLAMRGDEDDYILDSVVSASSHWAANFDYRVIPAAGHWVHEENPSEVNDRLLRLLAD